MCEVCSYQDYFSYGGHTVGAGVWEGYYGYNTDHQEVTRIRNEFARQIAIARRERKRNRQFYYAKKKSQRKTA